MKTEKPKTLKSQVLRQLGGTKKENMEALRDVASHGADTGFPGFVYCHETVKFFNANRRLILEALRDEANDTGETVTGMVGSFRCLKGIGSDAVVGVLLDIEGDGDEVDTVKNALAWYALERVASGQYGT